MQLVDGTGRGYRAKIDQDNRVLTSAMSDLVIAVKSFEDGDAYQMFVPSKTLGGTSEHNLLYFKNTSETRYLAINKYFICWNGGSTNFNRVMTVRQYLGPTAPTTNSTQSGAGNINTSSGNTAPATVYYWDGVGTTGMTVSSRGTQAGEVIVAQGMTPFDVQGSTVLGPGSSLLITVQGTEVGICAVTIEAYFLDK